MIGLPIPRLTATITPPARKGDLGVVVIAGYMPAPSKVDDAPRTRRNRKRIECSLCGKPGHASSNTKHHQRST